MPDRFVDLIDARENPPLLAGEVDATTDVLTKEDIEAAIERIYDMPADPCRQGLHCVHARALYRPGIYMCGFCGVPVKVSMPLIEMRTSSGDEAERS